MAIGKAAGVSEDNIPIHTFVSSSPLRKQMNLQMVETYNNLCDALVKAHHTYRTKEKKFEKDKSLHGSLTEEKTLELDTSKKFFEKMFSSVTTLSESIGHDVPELRETEEDEESAQKSSLSLFKASNLSGSGGDFGPYDDAESKSFYEEYPDLLAMVPLSALGFTIEQTFFLYVGICELSLKLKSKD